MRNHRCTRTRRGEIGGEPAGVAFILASSACWAAYIVVGSRVAVSSSGVDGLAVGLAIGSLLSCRSAPHGADLCGVPRSFCSHCLVTGVFSNAIGYGIDQYVLREVSVRRFSVLLAMLPVTAVIVGWVALSQQPSALDLVGIIAVLIGVSVQERIPLSLLTRWFRLRETAQ